MPTKPVGRNEPCPCGSGKKYKKCHLEKDEAERVAAARAKAAEEEAKEQERLQKERARREAFREADRQATAEALRESQALDAASNAVVDLLEAGKLDEAEQAARELLKRYPQVPDGHERLASVYEARGDHRQAADCYRKVIEFIRANPDHFDPEYEQYLVEKLAVAN